MSSRTVSRNANFTFFIRNISSLTQEGAGGYDSFRTLGNVPEIRANSSFLDDFTYWSTQGNNDTMVSIHNKSEKDVPTVVTIGSNDGTRRVY